MAPRTVWTFNFSGWILFTLSALGFTWATWRAGDMVGTFASVAFLVACVVFIIPMWLHRPSKTEE